jgi:hypothetical protein
MALALTVAFGLGIRDPNNRMALEVQLFMPLITMLTLPMLSAVLLQWKKSQRSLSAHGSTIALASIFVASSGIALWGEVSGRYTGLCKLFSGLGGTSVKASAGWNAWVALLSLLTAVALTSLVACCVMIWGAARGREIGDSPARKWIESQPRICIAWSLFAVGIWITSVASVQLTIRRHMMITSSLTDRDYGQWISLCVAIGSVCTLVWVGSQENYYARKERSKRRTADEDGGESGLTDPSPRTEDSPHDADTRELPNELPNDVENRRPVVPIEDEGRSPIKTTVGEPAPTQPEGQASDHGKPITVRGEDTDVLRDIEPEYRQGATQQSQRPVVPVEDEGRSPIKTTVGEPAPTQPEGQVSDHGEPITVRGEDTDVPRGIEPEDRQGATEQSRETHELEHESGDLDDSGGSSESDERDELEGLASNYGRH